MEPPLLIRGPPRVIDPLAPGPGPDPADAPAPEQAPVSEPGPAPAPAPPSTQDLLGKFSLNTLCRHVFLVFLCPIFIE